MQEWRFVCWRQLPDKRRFQVQVVQPWMDDQPYRHRVYQYVQTRLHMRSEKLNVYYAYVVSQKIHARVRMVSQDLAWVARKTVV